MKQTILIVEDDVMIQKLIKMYLEKNNFSTVLATDGETAKDVYENEHPCLIILDLMLPKLSGEDFTDWLRREKKDTETPILILSAKTQTKDKVHGLNLGADGYLTKPFEPEELIAQVEAILRRTGKYCSKIAAHDLILKPRKKEVLLYNKLVNLTKHEFELLSVLMENPNIVFSREQLVHRLYRFDEQDILDRTIDAHIKKLREKIEDIPSKPSRIKTVRGMGYKFVQK